MPLPAGPDTAAGPAPRRSDWATLQRLFPYLWQYKWRVGFALGFMVAPSVALANTSSRSSVNRLVDRRSRP
jgi:ATP-binding cassette subfamily B protein